jgi:hypothetical protein
VNQNQKEALVKKLAAIAAAVVVLALVLNAPAQAWIDLLWWIRY